MSVAVITGTSNLNPLEVDVAKLLSSNSIHERGTCSRRRSFRRCCGMLAGRNFGKALVHLS